MQINFILTEIVKNTSVIIKTHMVEHDGGYHLLEVSYSSKSWNGNGTLCDDGWDNREAEIVCKQNGFNVSGNFELRI